MLHFVGIKKFVPTKDEVMYIKYYYSNGCMYARLQEAKRDEHGKKYERIHCQLGRVIDEAEGIFNPTVVFTYVNHYGRSNLLVAPVFALTLVFT